MAAAVLAIGVVLPDRDSTYVFAIGLWQGFLFVIAGSHSML